MKLSEKDTRLVARALKVIENHLMGGSGEALTSPEKSANYFRLRLGVREQEVFACLFLDNRHRVIAVEELFHGTFDRSEVYPREVVKQALAHNAAAVILAHNHPSGVCEPSPADQRITEMLVKALDLVGVRVLDHLVVGNQDHTSFAVRGLL